VSLVTHHRISKHLKCSDDNNLVGGTRGTDATKIKEKHKHSKEDGLHSNLLNADSRKSGGASLVIIGCCWLKLFAQLFARETTKRRDRGLGFWLRRESEESYI
jgi:hypothetical protein